MADRSLEWKTLTSTVTYECPGFRIRQDRVHLPDGTETTFDYLEDDESVVIIPFTPDNDLVVIEEWRQAVDRVSFGFPAGGAEPDDTDITVTAHRELAEETGYTTDELSHLITVEPANGISNATHHYFVAHECEETTVPNHDHNESIRVRMTSLARLRSQIAAGEIRDGRTVLGVLYYDLQSATSLTDHSP